MITNTLKRKVRLTAVALSLVFSFILLSADSAQAQRRNDRRTEARWGTTNKRAVENLIRRVEDRTDRFINQLDRSLDNSRMDGTRREDRLNESARQLEAATDELRREFDRSDSLQENRDEVQRIISIASEIDRILRRGSRVRGNTQNNWRNLRQELNALARVYGVRSV